MSVTNWPLNSENTVEKNCLLTLFCSTVQVKHENTTVLVNYVGFSRYFSPKEKFCCLWLEGQDNDPKNMGEV